MNCFVADVCMTVLAEIILKFSAEGCDVESRQREHVSWSELVKRVGLFQERVRIWNRWDRRNNRQQPRLLKWVTLTSAERNLKPNAKVRT